MPSPLGHALAGAAIAWSAEAVRRQPLRFLPRSSTIAAVCTALAISPDLDFLYPPVHRGLTHSLSAMVVAALAVATVMWWYRSPGVLATVTVCALAYGSHLFLDWLGGDTKRPPGIQLLWPFSDAWFISSITVFPPTDLRGFTEPAVMRANVAAVLMEVVLLLPFAIAALAWRQRRMRGRGSHGRGPKPAVGRRSTI